MLIETLGDGGIAHYTFNLANALAERGSYVILFTSKYYEFAKKDLIFKVTQRMFRVAFYLTNLFPNLSKENGFFSFLRRTIKLIEYPLNIIEALFIAKKYKIHIAHFQLICYSFM